jgi:BirA family biotin operon repressor/biotin-[acetyl-CoA-carboxylase] ligase
VKIGEFHAPHRKLVGRTVWHYDAVESTQETAKELLEADLEDGLVIWADRQAAGRGRHGRAWASPKGGLYVSLILRPKGPHAQVLQLLMGIPVVKALRHFGVLAGLKWPNDAMYQGRKLAGILAEGVHRRETFHVIVGVGVNTNVDLEQLPPDVRATATSLRREVPLFVSNEEFLDYFLDQADQHASRYLNTPIEILMRDYRGQCTTIGKRVSVATSKGKVVGRGFDITPDGHLVVLDDEGTKVEVADGTVDHLA